MSRLNNIYRMRKQEESFHYLIIIFVKKTVKEEPRGYQKLKRTNVGSITKRKFILITTGIIFFYNLSNLFAKLVDLCRLVKGTFNSEAALIKRYSDPISFLKYKLKRTRDLSVTDLTQTDQDYYFQIGGLSDVEMTMYKQANIDSLPKTADINKNGIQTGEPPAWKRRRCNNNENTDNSNNCDNMRANCSLDLTSVDQSLMFSQSNVEQNEIRNSYQQPKVENPPLNQALYKLNKSLTEYEEEQVQKKKQLAVLLTNEKTKAYMEMYALKLGAHPEFLGLLPSSSFDDQLTAGFDLWLYEYKQSICNKVGNIHDFINELALARSDGKDWLSFLHKWKLQRIFHRDAFSEVWSFVVQELHITIRTEIADEKEDEIFDLNVSLA